MKEVTLKRALMVYLHDTNSENQEDLTHKSDDDDFVDVMVSHLSEGGVCPFKNYECVHACGSKCGKDRFDIDCGKEYEDVWRDFISKNEPD